ncbi:LysR family transcriptional regulator [Thalassospira marina]|uniref:LysR family transcriptional regulator n=1 Tax=Thalassospira marina TaxID=2048283 RepID=A0A2N3KSV6_9PROT|nr:LysR family transcriptional regulator [Thalassospira marina]PKR53600.1 LysR family transcriptional regulator [Thalassospira marina]
MDTRFLESVIIVAELGSVAAAARQQGLTAAAISQRLKTLETELGVVLFRRNGKTVQATAECSRLLPHARKMVAQAALLSGALDEDNLAGTLKIGAISTVMTSLLPLTLKHLRKVAPLLVPEIYPGTSVNLHDRISSQELDVIVAIAPPFERSKSLEARNLRSEPLMLMTPASVKPVGGNDFAAIAGILAQMPYIRYDPSSWGGRLAEQFLARHNMVPQLFCTIDSQETMARMVHEGLGVSLVPDWMRVYDTGLDLNWHRVAGDDFNRNIDLVYPGVSPKAPLIAAFCQAITNIHDQLLPNGGNA